MMPDSICTQSLYKQDCTAVVCGMFVQCTVVWSDIAIVGMLTATTSLIQIAHQDCMYLTLGADMCSSSKQTKEQINKHMN